MNRSVYGKESQVKMGNAVKLGVEGLVSTELKAANEKFPPFHSDHEGYAVILEEVEELSEEINTVIKYNLEIAWRAVKASKPASAAENISNVEAAAIRAACEAIQVAAMCRKFKGMEESPK